MAEINKRQAFVIEGADILPNDRGTAPGQWVEEAGARGHAAARPAARAEGHVRAPVPAAPARIVPAAGHPHAVLRVTGMPESDLDQLISPVYKKYSNPVTTILAANGDIQVHLRARCASEAEADALLAEVGAPDRSRCWATASTPATAIRSKWWSATSSSPAAPPSRWRKAAPAACLGERFTSGARQLGLLSGRLHHLFQCA